MKLIDYLRDKTKYTMSRSYPGLFFPPGILGCQCAYWENRLESDWDRHSDALIWSFRDTGSIQSCLLAYAVTSDDGNGTLGHGAAPCGRYQV
jgi:hypothetical protein